MFIQSRSRKGVGSFLGGLFGGLLNRVARDLARERRATPSKYCPNETDAAGTRVRGSKEELKSWFFPPRAFDLDQSGNAARVVL